MALIQTIQLNSGLTVTDAAIKITGLEYDEIKRAARIRVEIYKDLATSQQHNAISLQTDYWDLPEWDKSTPGNTFSVAYLWLQAQPKHASAISDESDILDGYI